MLAQQEVPVKVEFRECASLPGIGDCSPNSFLPGRAGMRFDRLEERLDQVRLEQHAVCDIRGAVPWYRADQPFDHWNV